jgi:hypothetical protein
MASPFKIFRKHQKVMLAALTILAMFSFVFLGVISQLIGRRTEQNPVVVRTSKYGNLRQRDLSYLRWERLRVFGVLERMLSRIYSNTNPQLLRQQIEYQFGTTSDEDLVNTWLLTRRAEELGMVVSNETINEFLQNISQNKITSADIAAIIKQEELTENQFFDIMREQLQALEISRLFTLSLQGISPAQRWDYFCQLRRQANVELIALAVEQFVSDTLNPGEAEIKAYFEQYKDKLPNPESPEPGFRIPQKIDLEYFKAEFDKFSDPATITEDEIQNCYEKNRDFFKQFEKEYPPALTPSAKKPPEKEGPETPLTDAEVKEGTKEPVKEQPKEQPAEEQKPAEQTTTPREKSPQEEPQKSSARERSPFSLTALAEQADKGAADSPPEQTQAVAPAPKQAERPEEAEPKAAEAPQSSTAAHGTEKTDAQAAQPPQPGTNQTILEKAEPPRRTIPEKIRVLVRAVVAREKIDTVLRQVQQVMEENGKKWRKYEAQKIHDQAATPPAKLDFDALAKKYGLVAEKTGLKPVWELRNYDIGSSGIQGSATSALALLRSLAVFKTDISIDAQGNGYLFWKVNETQEATPSLDNAGIRQEVLHAWKFNRARDLARKAAEQLAETARKSDASLKETFADRPELQVLTPAPFTFYTEGSVPRGSSSALPRLSQVEGAPLAGLDFMRTVFALDENQIGVAMNHPQTAAYVVRLVSYSPPQEALWRIFLADDFSNYYMVARIDRQLDQQVWLEDLKKSAGLKWEPRPTPQRQQQPDQDYHDYYD